MTLHRLARTGLITIALGLAVPAGAQPTSLYQRMGGYDRVASFVDTFFVRFDKDPQLAPFLTGLNGVAQGRIRQHFVDFICAQTGGPCLYTGNSMEAAHEGLTISARQFDAVLDHMRNALDIVGVPARERDELLARMRAFREAVVSGSAPGPGTVTPAMID